MILNARRCKNRKRSPNPPCPGPDRKMIYPRLPSDETLPKKGQPEWLLNAATRGSSFTRFHGSESQLPQIFAQHNAGKKCECGSCKSNLYLYEVCSVISPFAASPRSKQMQFWPNLKYRTGIRLKNREKHGRARRGGSGRAVRDRLHITCLHGTAPGALCSLQDYSSQLYITAKFSNTNNMIEPYGKKFRDCESITLLLGQRYFKAAVKT